MRIKVIIFELEGVICHTEKYHYLAWKEIADELGIPFTEELNRKLIGRTRMDSLGELLKNYPGSLSRAEQEVLAEQENNIFKEHLNTMAEGDIPPRIRGLLRRLKQEGYFLGAVSSSKNAGIMIKNLGLDSYFDIVSDGNVSKKAKSGPEVYLNICSSLRVQQEECLIVAGTSAGIRTAGKTGMHITALPVDAMTAKKTEGVRKLEDIEQLEYYVNHIYK